jgi:addiction module toxin, RelE/StbE family
MRTTKQTGQFKRDLKRESKGPYRKSLQEDFVVLIEALAADHVLDQKYLDHPLSGDWIDHRDCHIKPDLVLIYRKTEGVLQLVRLGSHSELGL